MYGWELKIIRDRLQCKAIAYLDLITRSNESIVEAIDTLYNTTIKDVPETLIKGIVNKTIGMCGKRRNKERETICFRYEDDAKMYILSNKKGAKFKFDKDIWIVNSIYENNLENGFRPISEAVLGMARLRLFNMSKQLQPYGILGYKTDSVFIRCDATTVNNFNFLNKCDEE